jgi:hypothetical protein
MAGLHGMPEFVLGGLGRAVANAVPAAPAAPGRHPVLVFLEGLTGYRQMNTFQVEALVSAGYVVVAIDQPFVASEVVFPGGRRAGTVAPAQMLRLLQPSIGPVDAAPTLHGRTFADGVAPHLAQDVVFTLDQLAVLDRTDRTPSWPGGWTCHGAACSGSRWGPWSAPSPAGSTRGCGPAC